jgi:hypothetical protein
VVDEGGSMNPLKKTLAIIALVILIPQCIRHAYLLWVEQRGSVLDKYDQPLKSEISGATSLETLLNRYDELHKQVEAAKKGAAESEKELTYRDRSEIEPFKSELALRTAIEDWENKAKEIRALRFYWFIGLAMLALGTTVYTKLNKWAGLSLSIVAFGEFIYWTSPTFFGSSTQEFHRLLLNKLIFSLVSLALLAGTIWVMKVFEERNKSIR